MQNQSQPPSPTLGAAADADAALKSLIGQQVAVLTTYTDAGPFTPSAHFGCLLAVFPDAIVMLTRLPPTEAESEVLIYKQAIVSVHAIEPSSPQEQME